MRWLVSHEEMRLEEGSETGNVCVGGRGGI
jgi:hypothetical protein